MFHCQLSLLLCGTLNLDKFIPTDQKQLRPVRSLAHGMANRDPKQSSNGQKWVQAAAWFLFLCFYFPIIYAPASCKWVHDHPVLVSWHSSTHTIESQIMVNNFNFIAWKSLIYVLHMNVTYYRCWRQFGIAFLLYVPVRIRISNFLCLEVNI